MSSNVHSHIHLPQHVLDYGPLHKFNTYSFENLFKISMNKFFGTRNFEGQVANNLQQSKIIKSFTNYLYKNCKNERIPFFINKHLKNIKENVNKLVNPTNKILGNFLKHERDIFLEINCERNVQFNSVRKLL